MNLNRVSDQQNPKPALQSLANGFFDVRELPTGKKFKRRKPDGETPTTRADVESTTFSVHTHALARRGFA